MGSFLGQEVVTTLQRTGDNTVQLPAGSRVFIGGRMYPVTSALSCDITTSGTGGLDTGSPAANTVLYFFLVLDSGVLKLIASTSSVLPLGFIVARFVGSMNVNYNTILGALLHDSNGTLQEIDLSVVDASVTFSPGLTNGVQSTLLFSTILKDSHLGYDPSIGKWYPPIAKGYSASGSVGLSGTYANGGVIDAKIRADGFGNIAGQRQVNSASSGSHVANVTTVSRTRNLGEAIYMTVTPANWPSIVGSGTTDSNFLTIKG